MHRRLPTAPSWALPANNACPHEMRSIERSAEHPVCPNPCRSPSQSAHWHSAGAVIPPALCLDKHGSGRCGLLRARWRRRARALRPKAPPWAPPPPAFTTFCMQAHTHTSVRGRRLGRRLGRRHHLRLLRWLRPFLPVPPARTPAHTHARMSSGSDHANDLVAHVLRGEGSSARLEQPPVGRRPAAHERTHAR